LFCSFYCPYSLFFNLFYDFLLLWITRSLKHRNCFSARIFLNICSFSSFALFPGSFMESSSCGVDSTHSSTFVCCKCSVFLRYSTCTCTVCFMGSGSLSFPSL
jgi:hypothetical protein